MKKLKVWLLISLVFVAGFAAGVVVTRAVVRHYVRVALTNPDRVRSFIETRIARRLRLDAQQRQDVDRILARTQDDLRQLRSEFTPRFREIVTNAESRISATLTPEQREKFDQLREENRRLWPALRRQP